MIDPPPRLREGFSFRRCGRPERVSLHPKQALSGMLVACLCLLTTAMLMPRIGNAQDAQVTKSMAALKDRTAKLGAPKIEGKAAVGGKEVPALFFGSTKMNNNVAVVDEVTKAGGKGVAATLFVKDGDQFVRVATTVAKPDKTGRAIGTALDPGPALDALKSGKAYSGEVSVFDKPYVTDYEPITDSSGQIIGAYFVGRKK
jgi:hypothetical protein